MKQTRFVNLTQLSITFSPLVSNPLTSPPSLRVIICYYSTNIIIRFSHRPGGTSTNQLFPHKDLKVLSKMPDGKAAGYIKLNLSFVSLAHTHNLTAQLASACRIC